MLIKTIPVQGIMQVEQCENIIMSKKVVKSIRWLPISYWWPELKRLLFMSKLVQILYFFLFLPIPFMWCLLDAVSEILPVLNGEVCRRLTLFASTELKSGKNIRIQSFNFERLIHNLMTVDNCTSISVTSRLILSLCANALEFPDPTWWPHHSLP